MTYGATAMPGMIYTKLELEKHPACLIEGLSPSERDRVRIQTLEQLNLLGPASTHIPVFEEAAQTVSRLLAAPICLVSVLDDAQEIFRASVGLSSLGLMNQLAAQRELPRQESFCTHVVDSTQTVILEDTTQHPAFSNSLLVQRYGIQAYIGVPLTTSEGQCIGTLSVMDLLPRKFTAQEVNLLELNARWCMSEYEKQILQAKLVDGSLRSYGNSDKAFSAGGGIDSLQAKINGVRLGLISQLTQDLRNPLTAITGMASMLSREIYGPLTNKQQEYANIVLDSSQNLLTLVDEIIGLGGLEEDFQQLSLAPVDIEMLAQQSLQALEKVANQEDQTISLTVEPSSRIWVIDKRVLRQLLYHLVFSLIKMSSAGSTVRIHISRKEERLTLSLWISNPWLGEDLPQTMVNWCKYQSLANTSMPEGKRPLSQSLDDVESPQEISEVVDLTKQFDTTRQELGLLLSHHLSAIHQGTAVLQGSMETGYRYVISLPAFNANN
jgi:signal transduction histidine kinase